MIASSPLHRRMGFTLVELLITMTIIAVLSALTLSVVLKMKSKTEMLEEINAGKNLIAAYQLAASENGGNLLPGMDYGATGVTDAAGKKLSGHTKDRFPYRLLPYLQGGLEGSILLKRNSQQLTRLGMGSYLISALPALGMNCQLVGGYKSVNGTYEYECLTNIAQADDPHILVFASGGTYEDGELIAGYNTLASPTLAPWTAGPEDNIENPEGSGNVSFRHGKKAVCAFLDGSVATLGKSELSDMRQWSIQARRLDDPHYVPQKNTNY